MSAKMSPIAAYYPKPERKRTDIITYQDFTYSQGKIKHGRQLLKKEKNTLVTIPSDYFKNERNSRHRISRQRFF